MSNEITTQVLVELRQEMAAVRKSFEERFTRVDERFDSLEVRLSSKIDGAVSSLRTDLRATNRRLEEHIVATNQRFAVLDLKVAETTVAVEQLAATVVAESAATNRLILELTNAYGDTRQIADVAQGKADVLDARVARCERRLDALERTK